MGEIGQHIFDAAKDDGRSRYDSDGDSIDDGKHETFEQRRNKRNVNKGLIGSMHDQDMLRRISDMGFWLSVKSESGRRAEEKSG